MLATPRRHSLARLSFMLVLATTAIAAWSQAAVESAPVWREGDRWEFRTRDGFTSNELFRSSQRVTEARPNGYRIEWSRPEGLETIETTLDLNDRQVIDGVARDTQELVFPLVPGRTWKSVTLHLNPGRMTQSTFELERTVVEVGRVKTPAGEFDAVKIVGKGHWTLKADPLKFAVTDFAGRLESTQWFAPAVKNFVVVELRAYAKGHVGNWTRAELTSFELH